MARGYLPPPEPAPPAEPAPLPEPAPAPDAPPVLPAPEPPMPLPLGDELLPPLVPAPDVVPPLPVVPPPELGLELSPPFSSRRQFSRSGPTIARHLLLLVLPVVALGVEVLLPVVALGVELGVEVLLPVVALGVELVPPVEEELELCAIETLASARSAAAVAALRIFNVIPLLPPYLVVLPDPLPEPEPMPDPLPPEPEPAPPLGCLGALLGEAPLPEAPLPELLPVALPLVPPPAAAPEPDLLKYASHSCRETWPSLLVSASEKFGVFGLPVAPAEAPVEPLPEALGVALLPAALGVELLPAALGVELLLPDALGVALLPEVLPAALGVELLPEAPDELLPDADEPLLALSAGLLSVALVLEPLDPEAPLLVLGVLELCASATLASAKSAAAVALPTTVNNM